MQRRRGRLGQSQRRRVAQVWQEALYMVRALVSVHVPAIKRVIEPAAQWDHVGLQRNGVRVDVERSPIEVGDFEVSLVDGRDRLESERVGANEGLVEAVMVGIALRVRAGEMTDEVPPLHPAAGEWS